jgi:predicted GNAT family acetyltransferase
MDTAAIDVQHEPQAQRFVARVDGLLSEASYRLEGATMVMHHTGVPRALEGRGIAAALVQAALAHARVHGLTVRPVCSYVRVYMQRHPDTQDLLA